MSDQPPILVFDPPSDLEKADAGEVLITQMTSRVPDGYTTPGGSSQVLVGGPLNNPAPQPAALPWLYFGPNATMPVPPPQLDRNRIIAGLEINEAQGEIRTYPPMVIFDLFAPEVPRELVTAEVANLERRVYECGVLDQVWFPSE